MNQNDLRTAGHVSGGAVLGFLCGYLLHRHLSMARFDARVATEVADVKAHYRSLANVAGKGDNPAEAIRSVGTPVATADEYAEAMESYGAANAVPELSLHGEGPRRPFAYHKLRGSQDQSVQDDEQLEDGAGEDGSRPPGAEEGSDPSRDDADFFASRDTTQPYPITLAEFTEEHDDWSKLTVVYYEADKVLVDDKEIPIREILNTIGPQGLEFGLASEDEHIVYIRNEHLEIDFEVTRDRRSFTEHVLGNGNPRLTARARQGQL
jgi:hypothetical protein